MTYRTPKGALLAKYTGDWMEGKRHGQGIFINYRSNGEIARRFEGSFVNDHKHGAGVQVFTEFMSSVGSTIFTNDSREFRGRWTRGQLTGKGTLQYTDGRLYVGEFYNGLRHGYGVMTFPDGRRYDGNYLND